MNNIPSVDFDEMMLVANDGVSASAMTDSVPGRYGPEPRAFIEVR